MRRSLFILMLAFTGCGPDYGPVKVENPDLRAKVPAIKQEVREHSLDEAPQLVKDLDNDDPAVRFYAFEGLRRLTGQTLDYRYYDDAIERKPAITRWKQWLEEQKRK
jgi:hypothetical protein